MRREVLYTDFMMNRIYGLVAVLFLCAFAIPAHADPLDRVRTSVRSEVRAGRVPIVVFNIDGTIFDNRPRSQAILRDFIAYGGDSYAEIADSVYALRQDSINYYVVDSFRSAGIANLFFMESALKYWSDHFFSNRYVVYDLPINGSVAFINEMHDAGALIVYLSGRGRTTMLEGTIQSLNMAGFPVASSRTLLVMKPSPRENNLTYKAREYQSIARLGKVVAAFENDPRAAVAMQGAWPHAQIIVIATPHEGDTAPLSRTAVLNSYR